MRGRFTKIKQELADLLDDKLLADIYDFRLNRLSHLSAIIQRIRTVLSESSGMEAIAEAIEELKVFPQSDGERSIQKIIIADIFALKDTLPRRKIIQPPPERFQILQGDTLFVKAGKIIKQLMRRAGKTEWQQNIPLQNVMAYHLLDADWFYKDWMAAEERFRMKVILELDHVLVNRAQRDVQERDDGALWQLLRVVQNHIEESERVHKEKLIESRDQFIEQFIEDYAKVGTFEQRAGFYSRRRLLHKRNQTKKTLDQYLDGWQDVNRHLLERTAALHQFLVFCNGLQRMTKLFQTDMRGAFGELFYTPCGELEEQASSLYKQIDPAENDLSTVLDEHKHDLLQTIKRCFIEPIEENGEQNEMQRHLELYAGQLIQRTDNLDETTLFITDIDRSNDPPETKAKRIEWRSLVTHYLKKKLIGHISQSGQAIEALKVKQLQEAPGIKNLVKVNLKAASELTKNGTGKEDPHEITGKALQQIETKIEVRRKKAKEIEAAMLDPLQDQLTAFRLTLFDLLHHGDTEELKKYAARGKVKNQLGEKVRAGWQKTQYHGTRLNQLARKKASQYYRKNGHSKLNGNGSAADSSADVKKYIAETQQKIEELPYIYRQLFNINRNIEEEHYVSPDEDFNALREARDQWEQGAPASFAVIGEEGSGKASYYDIVQTRLFTDKEIWHITLHETVKTEEDLLALFNSHFEGPNWQTVEELIASLNNQPQKHTIIFEGVQHLYLRHLSGYEAIEKFIKLVSETCTSIFWMISCSRYAWNFLSEAVSLNTHFSHLIETDALSERQLQKVIMNRHQASGYELVFTPPEAENGSYKQWLHKAKKPLEEQYFAELAKVAEGNASVAIIYWLRSIRKFDDNYCYVALPPTNPLQVLNHLSTETLFYLAAVATHGRLIAGELSTIQHVPRQEAQIALRALRNQGVITDRNQRFSVNPLIYRSVITKLKRAHLLGFPEEVEEESASIEIYLPASINIEQTKQMAYQAAISSRYIYPKKPVSVTVKSEMHGHRFVIKFRIQAYILERQYEAPFQSNITEQIMKEVND